MKHFSLFPLALMVSVLFFSCKKNDSGSNSYVCTTCIKTPEALAANDNSSKGIYKGVVIGSTGTIKFNIGNDGNTINAVMIIDGTTVNLTSNITWQAGQAYIAPFTGTLSGQQVSITFSVSADGQQPQVTASNIPGHPNAILALVKETSNSLIECFEGTFTGAEQGTLNILLSRTLNKWGGIVRKNGTTDESDFDGSINGNTLVADGVSGTLTNDAITGTWDNGRGSKGTWNAKRTL